MSGLIRHTRTHPCEICGSFDETRRGAGLRCHGYTHEGRSNCSREEFAGALSPNRAGLYPHRLRCRCADGCTCAARGHRAPGCWCAARCSCCLCGTEHSGVTSVVATPVYSNTPSEEGDAERIRKALQIWKCRKPLCGTPGERYLLNRGIKIKLEDGELGYAPNLKYWSGDDPPKIVGRFPALVAPFRNAPGEITGVLMTYLDREGHKATVEPVKKMRGPVGGCALRFGGIASQIALTEGIENALSVRQATGMVSWAAGSLVGLKLIELPAAVRRIIVVADPKPQEIAGAEEAARRLIAQGREALVAYPRDGRDVNDLLRGGR